MPSVVKWSTLICIDVLLTLCGFQNKQLIIGSTLRIEANLSPSFSTHATIYWQLGHTHTREAIYLKPEILKRSQLPVFSYGLKMPCIEHFPEVNMTIFQHQMQPIISRDIKKASHQKQNYRTIFDQSQIFIPKDTGFRKDDSCDTLLCKKNTPSTHT